MTTHLVHPDRPDLTLCGEKATRLGESDSMACFGHLFTCEDCKKVLQSCLDRFAPAEWGMIADVAAKRGFTMTFEKSPAMDGSISCSAVGPTIHHIVYRGSTAIAAALTVSKEIVKLCRDTLRTILWSADGEKVSGTRDAFQRAKVAMEELERAIALHEELRAISEAAEGKKP